MTTRSAGHRPDVHRRVVALAIPAIGSLVADPLLGVVDTAVAGRLGAVPLGALGLGTAVLAALTWVFNFLVFGTTTWVAKAVGAGRRREASEWVAHAATTALVLGLLSAVVLMLAAPALVVAVGAVHELVDPTVAYLRIRALGIPFALLGFVGHGAFRGVADTKTPLFVAVMANVLNGALDLLLVFGLRVGLDGIAWATVAAEIAAVVMFVALLRRLGLGLGGHGLPSRARLRRLFAVSRNLVIRTGSLLLGLLAVSSAAARVSAETAAAHQVIWQIWIVISFLMDGFAIAGQTLVGTALGADDKAGARAAVRAMVSWGIGGGALVAVILLAGSEVLPRLLTDDPATLSMVATAWWIAAAGELLNGVVFTLDGALMGADDFAYLARWMVAAAVVGAVGAQLAVALGTGLPGLWTAVAALMGVRAFANLRRLRGDAWMRHPGVSG